MSHIETSSAADEWHCTWYTFNQYELSPTWLCKASTFLDYTIRQFTKR